MSGYKNIVNKLLEGDDLGQDEMREAISSILSGNWNEIQTTAFLVAMRHKGIIPSELAEAASILMELRVPVEIERPEEVLDTAGTGGDGKGAFNVSTAAAFVAAACGVRVAKHGNRAQSGSCGSSDLLAALGADLTMPPERISGCLAKAGICFMFAPAHHPALKQVAPVRQQIGTRTMFNLLGPLVNPARAGCRLAGIFDPAWLVRYAETFASLGVVRAVVVHSDGMDEAGIEGSTQYVLMEDGKVTTHEVAPEDVGLERHPLKSIVVSDVEQALEAFDDAIDGKSKPHRDAAALNAGLALLAAGKAAGLNEGVAMALAAIDEGRVRQKADDYLKVAG